MSKNPIIYLTRRASFSASHRLHSACLSDEENKRLFGKCNHVNGHGHNYVLEVTIRGEVDPVTGIVINLVELKDIIEHVVISNVDHIHLNMDVPEFALLNPTAENMAVVFWRWMEHHLPAGRLYEITLHETENNKVVYRGE